MNIPSLVLVLFLRAQVAIAISASLLSRMNHLSTSVKLNINYLLQSPMKTGALLQFASGSLKKSPLTTPVFSLNDSAAAITGPLQQMLYGGYRFSPAVYKIQLGINSTGYYWYYSQNNTKNCDTFAFRSGDPASCGATTSTLPEDTSYSGVQENCLQIYYIDGYGTPTMSFVNTNYDPRLRTWYSSAAKLGSPCWSPLYLFDNQQLGLTYAVPLYASSQLMGVLGISFSLPSITTMLHSLDTTDVITYIATTSGFQLIGASTGESTLAADGKCPKNAINATNTLIRESAFYLTTKSITAEGIYSYTGSDGFNYQLQLTQWTDTTGTLKWTIVTVTWNKEWVLDISGDAKLSASRIAADLTAFTNDALYPVEYLQHLTGNSLIAPLSAPILLSNLTQPSGLTQQALWGCLASFPNSAAVWVTYADNSMALYNRLSINGNSQSYFFKNTGSFSGYALNSDGSPVTYTFASMNSYTPTGLAWYNVANKTQSWSPFFEFPMARGIANIAYVSPILNADGSKAGVVAVSRLLTSFTTLLAPYASTTGTAYILDNTYNLLATSNGENVWMNTAVKAAALSTDPFVWETATYIQKNQINTENTYTMTLTSTGLLVAIVHKPWADNNNNLHWKIVVVTAITAGACAASATTTTTDTSALSSMDMQTTRDASSTAAVFTSFVFVMTSILLYFKATELAGGPRARDQYDYSVN